MSSEPQSKSKNNNSDDSNLDNIDFSGNIFIFYSFDVGDDINLQKVKESKTLIKRPLMLPKYFKGYHTPLEIEVPHPHTTSHCMSAKLHNFGAMSLAYKIPFNEKLKDLPKELSKIVDEFREQSISDAGAIFKNIKEHIKQPKFFHLHKSYVMIQLNKNKYIDKKGVISFKKEYGNRIASLVRFEKEYLSEFKKNEILNNSIGYYRGDLIIIDTDAAFIYDNEYEELLDLFEFANLQEVELQYFDQLLDKKLNLVYEKGMHKIPFSSYIPFIEGLKDNTILDLGKLQVDISVITERLENSIKLAGEPYYSDIYSMLIKQLDLKNWQDSINHKLSIIKDVYTVYEDKIAAQREDILTILIIILIFIELIVGILDYLK